MSRYRLAQKSKPIMVYHIGALFRFMRFVGLKRLEGELLKLLAFCETRLWVLDAAFLDSDLKRNETVRHNIDCARQTANLCIEHLAAGDIILYQKHKSGKHLESADKFKSAHSLLEKLRTLFGHSRLS